jgi:hypothetical protein
MNTKIFSGDQLRQQIIRLSSARNPFIKSLQSGKEQVEQGQAATSGR